MQHIIICKQHNTDTLNHRMKMLRWKR